MKKHLVAALFGLSTLALLSGCWGKKAEEVQTSTEEAAAPVEAKEMMEETPGEQTPAAE